MSRGSTGQNINGPFGELLMRPDTKGKSVPHYHRTHAIGITRAGGGILFAMGRAWPHSVGDIVVTNPLVSHWGRPSAGGLDYSLFYPRRAWLQSLLSQEAVARGPHFDRPVIKDQPLALQLQRAFEALAAERDDAPLREAVRTLCSTHALDAPSACPPREEGAASCPKSPALHAGASIARLAAQEGLSRAHHSRTYRKAVGLSPRDHRRQSRVLAARQLIETGTGLAEAAAAAGFADQAHMTRQFRQILGVTPTTYTP